MDNSIIAQFFVNPGEPSQEARTVQAILAEKDDADVQDDADITQRNETSETIELRQTSSSDDFEADASGTTRRHYVHQLCNLNPICQI